MKETKRSYLWGQRLLAHLCSSKAEKALFCACHYQILDFQFKIGFICWIL